MNLNLGILAHVDAGKTSLTERLLYTVGVIDEIGKVDDGNTQTDSLALEQKRGITIKSAVVSFVIDDITVNLIDTPGHPDFIAEVERVLHVLDGAVLVISAVEGVQAQTRVLMRTLQRLNIPTLLFINKIDRSGAQTKALLNSISEKITPAIISMGWVSQLGSRNALFTLYNTTDASFLSQLLDLVADHNEELMTAYINDETTVSHELLCAELAAQTKRALVHPVFFGSAMTGAGVDSLIGGLKTFLPTLESDVEAPVSGTVFKIERGSSGEKIAYVRLFSGTVKIRDRLPFGQEQEGKVTAINVFERGAAIERSSLKAGQIGKLWGLAEVQIGDGIGVARSHSEHYFDLPHLETVVATHRPDDKAALYVALTQLAEQDPLINLRQDDVRQELYVSLYGEVQKEVIGATLANDYKLEATFSETTVICAERPVGVGEAAELLGKSSNPFLATIGLRVEPAPNNTGIDFGLDVDIKSIPLYIYHSVDEFRRVLEETVNETLQQGLYGWRVTDCKVTLTHSNYMSPVSTSGDFRKLLPLVLMSALKEAGTRVCEPLHQFQLEVPADTLKRVLSALARLRALPQNQEIRGAMCLLEGEIPAARTHALQQQLPGLTRGEGVLETNFARFEPVSGNTMPSQPRSDHNPLHRKEYLMHILGWSSAKGGNG